MIHITIDALREIASMVRITGGFVSRKDGIAATADVQEGKRATRRAPVASILRNERTQACVQLMDRRIVLDQEVAIRAHAKGLGCLSRKRAGQTERDASYA